MYWDLARGSMQLIAQDGHQAPTSALSDNEVAACNALQVPADLKIATITRSKHPP
jgi:hypothetical protein